LKKRSEETRNKSAVQPRTMFEGSEMEREMFDWADHAESVINMTNVTAYAVPI
jgi:hypothetical protein